MEAVVGLVIVLGICMLPLFWFIGTYNGLVRTRNTCDEAWSDIDTELKRRYDLIPNLVETVKGYATHEKQVLEGVIAARNRACGTHGSVADQARDEREFVGALKQLFAVVEGYPELKSNRNFLELQRELANTEDRIQAARRFYNGNVRDLNTRVEMVPSNMVAGMFNFTRKEFYEVEDAAVRAAVKVEF